MIDMELLNKGFKLVVEEKYDEANTIFDELIKNNPENLSMLGMLSNIFIKTNQLEKAKETLRLICKVKENFETLITLGKLEYNTGRYDLAIGILDKATAIKPDESAYSLIIQAFEKIDLYANALVYIEKMLEAFPENIFAMSQIIHCYTNMGKMHEAKSLCLDFLQKHPQEKALWINLGILTEVMDSDYKKALECYKTAHEIDKEAPSPIYQLAVTYDRLNDFENAVKYFKEYIKMEPENAFGYSSLGMTYLRKKMFKEGYDNFFKREVSQFSLEAFSNNLYKIGDKFEEDIIIACDQGLGDHLQFIRYLPLIQDNFKSIQVASMSPLIDLFKKNYPNIDFINYQNMDKNKQAIRICDIPYLFNIDFENIPFSKGYLDAEPMDIKSDKLKIGICWEAGGVGLRGPLERTINPKNLESFFELENVQFYCLQLEDTFKFLETHPQIINLGKDFKNFTDTAKAVKSMDAVICVDTSVLHLAGAMGVKTLLLLPYVSDWRWFEDTKTTPWYDSVEIFKQVDPISWEEPIKDIVCRIKELSS